MKSISWNKRADQLISLIKIFDENYEAIYEIKPVLMLDKPIYVEFTALELSKRLMYDFYYNFI